MPSAGRHSRQIPSLHFKGDHLTILRMDVEHSATLDDEPNLVLIVPSAPAAVPEPGPTPLVSHYNNQYDPILGFGIQGATPAQQRENGVKLIDRYLIRECLPAFLVALGVFTFLLGHEASTRSYAHIGVPEAHHSISHHANDPEKLDKYAKIALYHLVRIGEFLDKLKELPDPSGTVFDTTLLYFGSGMSNGNAHDRNNPPALVLGGANGKLKGNRHLVMEHKEPTSNLLLALGDLAGAHVDSIGVSTGRLSL
mgnify:CR=1 FL=1